MVTENKGAFAMAIIGNTLNLGYNIPFVYLVWKNRSSKNISGTFLMLRFWGSISWLVYAVLVSDTWVGISYMVTLTATCMIYYIKFHERRKSREKVIEVQVNKEEGVLRITNV
jgi:uncharacterized protein with PQ loop repeat